MVWHAVNGDAAASPFTEPFSAILNHIIGHSELLIVTQTYRAQSTNKDFCLVNLCAFLQLWFYLTHWIDLFKIIPALKSIKKIFFGFFLAPWNFILFFIIRGLHSGMPGAALGTLEMVPKLASRPDDAAALVLPDQSWSVTTFHFGFWTFMQFMGEKIFFCTFLVKTQPLIILQWSLIPQINSHAWLKLSLWDFLRKFFHHWKLTVMRGSNFHFWIF